MTKDAESVQFTPRPPGRPSAKDRKRSIIARVIAFVIVFVVFVIVLRQVIDYEGVIDTLKALTPTGVGILLAAGFIWALPIRVDWGAVYFWRRKIKLGRLLGPFAASTPQ